MEEERDFVFASSALPAVPSVPRVEGGGAAQRGFTLIELMVVVAILGCLAALAIPSISSYQDQAKIAVAKSVGRQVVNSFAAYAAINPRNGYPNVDTCDELASVVTQNGFDFSADVQEQYCPVGESLFRKRCICQNPSTGDRIRYRCGDAPPAQCRLKPFGIGADIEYTFALSGISADLYLVAGTLGEVRVLPVEDLPEDGPIVSN